MGLLLEEHQDRRSVLDSAAETKPSVQGNLAYRSRGDVREINRNETKATALDEQIGGLQGLIEILAAHPERKFRSWRRVAIPLSTHRFPECRWEQEQKHCGRDR